ncbi:MltF family protein [Vibrio algicola]|uniref:Transporter substrate-binding domain-containing protein n=1 Tax=Vibrio algicola TaxID=2662262 RepID=A0A5Q0TK45_9VIBR|nr:lytic transglycosylase F [Vibrio algicola]
MRRFRLWVVALTLIPNLVFALELSPLSKQPYMGDLPELKKRGGIRVLVAADLGFYYIEKGQPKGIIAEILYHFEKDLRKNKLKIQIIPVQRHQLLPSLNAGYGDLAVANLTITPTRLQNYSFSTPIVNHVQELIVTNKNTLEIKTLKDLSGKEIWVRPSSSYFESLKSINQQLNTAGLPPIQINFVETSLQDYELMEMLNQNLLPATVIDGHKSRLWVQRMKNIRLHDKFPIRTEGQIAWAMRKNEPQLKKVVNRFVKTSKQGTLLGNVIYNKYLNHTKWLNTALSPKKLDRLNNLSAIFKQYSEQYQFDWLMVSAQSFQESRFNNNLVSHAGAVGLMQLLPTTANEPYINIQNIEKPGNNVHAGVKYMRFIQDRYYNDDNITVENQIYLSLASYNAGPAKIRKMRRLALKHGYDPNIWFNHVEVMARKYISREPVDYVANISRYYVIYKQLEKIQQFREKNQTEQFNHRYRYF